MINFEIWSEFSLPNKFFILNRNFSFQDKCPKPYPDRNRLNQIKRHKLIIGQFREEHKDKERQKAKNPIVCLCKCVGGRKGVNACRL